MKRIRIKSHVVTKTTPETPDAHNFAVDRETWESSVFETATLFSVVRAPDKARQEFRTFPSALMAAKAMDRALIYAIAPSERFVCLDHKDWDKCLVQWADRMHKVALEHIDKQPKPFLPGLLMAHALDALIQYGCPMDEAMIIARSVEANYKP